MPQTPPQATGPREGGRARNQGLEGQQAAGGGIDEALEVATVEIRNKPRSHPRSQIPKKPGPQKSLQEVAAARSTENLRRDKKKEK